MIRYWTRRDAYLLTAIMALVALITFRSSGFASPQNLVAVFNDTAILMIVALGQMAVMLTRSIDLSMASTLCFCGMVVAIINAAYPEVPLAAILAITMTIGAALGAINGLMVWKLGIPAIVVTLGTLAIYRGAAYVLSGGAWVNADQMSPAFVDFPRNVLIGIPVLSWFAIVVIAATVIVMARTPLGRSLYAVGINPTASVYAGIDVGRTRFAAFCLAGMLAGLSGYLWVSRYAIASVEVANGFELSIVAACVIGGISISGGVGTAVGAVLGALFLGIVNNALPIINVSPFWQMAISGAAIIMAVALNARSEGRPSRIVLKSAQTG